MESYRRTLWCCVLFITVFMAAGFVAARAEGAGSVSEAPAYRLAAFEGSVAVYVAGEEAPSLRTGIYLSELRAADRELIAEGVEVDSFGELVRLIEDLSS